jgi:hypothetical protein
MARLTQSFLTSPITIAAGFYEKPEYDLYKYLSSVSLKAVIDT